MKQSGIDWIGEIPYDWKTRQIRYLFSLRDERNYKPLSEVNLISVYTDKGVLQHSDIEQTTGNKAQNADGYKHVYKNDLVVNIILCWMGALGISDFDGVTSPAYDVYVPKDLSIILPKYYHYLFRTPQFNGKCYTEGRGIMQMRWRTYSSEFKSIKVPLPPKATQQRIAEYLDKKVSEIDSIIEESRKSIEEYKAWKQSVIFEAVTGNLKTESRKLKDETFTDKWQLIKIKYVAEYNTETLPENTKDEFNFNYIDIGSVKFGEGITNFQNMIFKDAPSRARRIVKKDDVIISSVRTYLRAIARIEESEIPQIASTGFVVFSSKPQKILPRFLFYAISSESFVGKVEANSVGISYPAINASQIANFKIPLPPLPEQESIAKMLDSKCAQIDSLITEKESLIADLTEYKKSLIFEVVTGKRSV